MSLSIRWRLTLWNTLGLAVVQLAFAIVIYALLRHALYAQIYRRLQGAREQLEQDSRMGTDADGRLRYWIYEWREHENLSAVVYNANGTVQERSEELAVDSVPPAPSVVGKERGRLDLVMVVIVHFEGGKIREIREYQDSTLCERVLGPFPAERKRAV